MALQSMPFDIGLKGAATRDRAAAQVLFSVSSTERTEPAPRIVVADDCADERDLLALMLQHHGFDVVMADDGDVALEAILAGGADALVSDLQMPRLDGLTLCRTLRSLRAYATLPIVVFTGADSHDPRLMPLHDIEVLRVLGKPTGLREIVPALVEMLATSRRSPTEWRSGATASI